MCDHFLGWDKGGIPNLDYFVKICCPVEFDVFLGFVSSMFGPGISGNPSVDLAIQIDLVEFGIDFDFVNVHIDFANVDIDFEDVRIDFENVGHDFEDVSVNFVDVGIDIVLPIVNFKFVPRLEYSILVNSMLGF